MNRKTRIAALLAAAGLLPLLTGCEGTPGNGNGPTGEPTEIRITTSIDALAKAPQLDQNGAGNFAPGDRFALNIAADGFESVLKNYTVGSTELFWEDLGLPDAAGTVNFSGCYPCPETVREGTFTFTAPSTADKDLLLAKAVRTDKGSVKPVKLAFSHALHKLAVRYVSDGSYSDEELAGVVTSLRALSSCTVDLEKGEILEGTQTAEAETDEVSGKEVAFLLVPQPKDGVALNVRFKGIDKTFLLPAATTEGIPLTRLEGGKTLTVELTVAKDGIRIDASQIGGWNSQGNIDGEIII